MPPQSKIGFILQTLTKLFDIKSSPDHDTEYFKNKNVSHAKLMRIIEYWLDQSKPIFGEPVVIQKTQSLQDAGVDLTVEFVSSRVKIGFQIKSYGDVKDKQFHKSVNAQISHSQRYKLEKLVIVIAGNMKDKTQDQRVRGLIAELEQRVDHYISIIPPEKTLPICQAYEAKQHPLSLVMLDFCDTFKITDGLSKSLSNKNRKVDITVNVNYLNAPKQDGKQMQYTLNLKPDELDILDRMENLHITGDTLKFSSEQFSKFTIDGIDQLKDGFQTLEITPSEDYYRINLEVLDDRGTTLIELDKPTFGIRLVAERNAYIILRDRRQKSLVAKLHFVENNIQMNFGINYYDVDLNQIRQAMEFLKALEEGKWIRIRVIDHAIDTKILIPKNTAFSNLDQVTIQLVDALLIIEEKSKIKLRMPEEISRMEIDQIVNIARLLAEEVFPQILTHVRLNRSDAKRFINMFTGHVKSGEFRITQIRDILDQKIPIDSTFLIEDYELKESINDIIQKIEERYNEYIEIQLKSINKNSLVRISISNKT